MAKLLKTQVDSCLNSSYHCLGWPWIAVSAAITYIKLRPGLDQQPGSLLVPLTANHKHLLKSSFALFCSFPQKCIGSGQLNEKPDLGSNRCLSYMLMRHLAAQIKPRQTKPNWRNRRHWSQDFRNSKIEISQPS